MTSGRILPVALAAAAVLAASGCGSSDAPMTDAERASFKGGGPGQPRSPEQQKAMNDFKEEFNRRHPSPAGGPPAGVPAPKSP